MKLLVTGATGFLGRFVVAEAIRRGHGVRALVRKGSQLEGIELAQVDLRSRSGLVEAIGGCDAVIHLAATKSGDIYSQLSGTVVGTENLLWAMDRASVKHIVHVSTFSVYEYLRRRSFSTITEESQLDQRITDRDEYAQTKLMQERMVLEHAKANEWRWTIVRPGMIYGEGNLFNSLIGIELGRRMWIRFGGWARMPLTYVENCAQAVVLAAEKPEAAGEIVNIVDDDLPRPRRYSRLVRAKMHPRPRIFSVPWTVMRAAARLAWFVNHIALENKAKLPGIFSPAKLHARYKPMRFTNAKAKRVLGWKPRYSLLGGVERSSAEAGK